MNNYMEGNFRSIHVDDCTHTDDIIVKNNVKTKNLFVDDALAITNTGISCKRDIIPNENILHDLGSETHKWNKIFASCVFANKMAVNDMKTKKIGSDVIFSNMVNVAGMYYCGYQTIVVENVSQVISAKNMVVILDFKLSNETFAVRVENKADMCVVVKFIVKGCEGNKLLFCDGQTVSACGIFDVAVFDGFVCF